MTGEQVAANLATVGQRIAGWLHGLPVKNLHNALCGLMVVWLLYGMAQLIGLFIDPSPVESPVDIALQPATDKTDHSSKVDISQLQSLDLFGALGAQTAPVTVAPVANDVEIDAKKTRLDLTLEGVVYTPVTSESVAVIVYQGKQEQYNIGDKLPVGGQVTLAKVLLDHVIIDNKGSYESLWLYDESKKASSTKGPSRSRVSRSAGVKDMRGNASTTSAAKDYRERLYKNPASLASAVRISPAQKSGKMVGYRVSPGKDRKQFSQFGFKPDDIVTSVNGIDLNEPSKALEIYKLMRTAKEANFSVDRNGEIVEILVSLDALE